MQVRAVAIRPTPKEAPTEASGDGGMVVVAFGGDFSGAKVVSVDAAGGMNDEDAVRGAEWGVYFSTCTEWGVNMRWIHHSRDI